MSASAGLGYLEVSTSGRSGTARALVGATAAVSALTLLGAALRFARLGAQGFWFDEGNTALLVHLSPGRMLGLIPQSESTPPLYYCVIPLALWQNASGNTKWIAPIPLG